MMPINPTTAKDAWKQPKVHNEGIQSYLINIMLVVEK